MYCLIEDTYKDFSCRAQQEDFKKAHEFLLMQIKKEKSDKIEMEFLKERTSYQYQTRSLRFRANIIEHRNLHSPIIQISQNLLSDIISYDPQLYFLFESISRRYARTLRQHSEILRAIFKKLSGHLISSKDYDELKMRLRFIIQLQKQTKNI